MNKSQLNMLLSALAAATLAACGGGGGGDSTPGTQQPTPVTPAPTPIQTTVPAPTYEPDSENLKVFNAINEERARCGFGKVAQNDKLDKATAGHQNYFVVNNIAYDHNQNPGLLAFTGVTPNDRAIAAGYIENNKAGWATEMLASMGSGVFGLSALHELFNAPYHANGLLMGARDVGISAGPRALVINYGLRNTTTNQMDALPDDAVLTFPCNGTRNIAPILKGEVPNPVPGRDLGVNPLGVSIQVMVKRGNSVAITSATMTNLTSGASVPMRGAIGKNNDPHGYFQANESYIAADVAMKPNTAYQATVNGTNNGKPFSRTFNFTTGYCMYAYMTRCHSEEI